MSNVYWDTMLFIYFFEEHPHYAPLVESIYKKMRRRQDVLQTSALTLGELLVAPLRQDDPEVAARIRGLFKSSEVGVLPFTERVAERYAQIRATYRIPPADAIHLASAADTGTELFLTNDKRLHDLVIPGIHFISGLESNPLV